MSTIEIRDNSLWPQHIHENEALKERLLNLEANEIVILNLDGTTSAWRRMKQGANKKPTLGLKPACDTSREWWTEQQEQRGKRVSISEFVE